MGRRRRRAKRQNYRRLEHLDVDAAVEAWQQRNLDELERQLLWRQVSIRGLDDAADARGVKAFFSDMVASRGWAVRGVQLPQRGSKRDRGRAVVEFDCVDAAQYVLSAAAAARGGALPAPAVGYRGTVRVEAARPAASRLYIPGREGEMQLDLEGVRLGCLVPEGEGVAKGGGGSSGDAFVSELTLVTSAKVSGSSYNVACGLGAHVRGGRGSNHPQSLHCPILCLARISTRAKINHGCACLLPTHAQLTISLVERCVVLTADMGGGSRDSGTFGERQTLVS